jgi:hypothetical protein
MIQPNLSSSTRPVINDADPTSLATVQNHTNMSQPIGKSPLDVQLVTSQGPHEMADTKWPILKEMSHDQGSKTGNKSIKQLSSTDRSMNNDRLQQGQFISNSKLTKFETAPVNTFPAINGSAYNLLPKFEFSSFPSSSEDVSSTKLGI